MFREKRFESSYIEWSLWSSWTGMLLGIELAPQFNKEFWSICFGVTLFYRSLFFIEYTKFKKKKTCQNAICSCHATQEIPVVEEPLVEEVKTQPVKKVRKPRAKKVATNPETISGV